MPLYACRWSNGDLTIVFARNREDAIEELDEFANAEIADLFVIKNFMADFRLTPEGYLALNRLGEETYLKLFERAYPVLDQVYLTPELQATGEGSSEEATLIEAAVEQEKHRLWGNQRKPPLAETELGRLIQAHVRIPSCMANRIVRQRTAESLTEFEGPEQKV